MAKDLYCQLGKSEVLKALFSQGKTSFSEKKLKECIAELQKEHPISEHEVNLKTQREDNRRQIEGYAHRNKNRQPIYKMPEELKSYAQQREEVFKLTNHYRYKLFKEGTSQEDRRKLALEILKGWQEIDRLWGIHHYFKEHRKLPPSETEIKIPPMSEAEMVKRINNLRSYISKAKKGKKYTLSIDEMEAEIKELERRLP